MNLAKYDKIEWDLVAEDIHQVIFGEHRPVDLNRFDFVLVAWGETNPVGYVTCRETDSESIYISYGGVFPESRNTELSKIGMALILDFLKNNYKRANMLVENQNIFMLKKALNHGFIPVGIANYVGKVYLDLRIEWGE